MEFKYTLSTKVITLPDISTLISRYSTEHNRFSKFNSTAYFLSDSCLECMAAAQIDFLHLELVVDASRLAYWLGKPVDASR